MANVTRLHELKVAVADKLALRGGLAGVAIHSADMGDEMPAREYIALIGEDIIEQEWAGIGQFGRDEQLTLTGAVYVMRPGGGEAIVREARSRCITLMGEIEALCTADPSFGGVVRSALARPAELHEIATPEGRVAVLRFEIRSGPTRLRVQ